MSLFFALLTLVGWGVGDVFVTLCSRSIGSVRAYFWIFFVSFIVTSFYIPFAPPLTDVPMLLFALLLNVIMVAAILAYFKGLEIGNASLVGAVVGSFGALVVLFSSLLYKEPISSMQWVGIILALSGVMLVTFKWQEIIHQNLRDTIKDKGLLLALFGTLVWGGYFTLIKIPTNSLGWFWPNYIRLALFPLVIIYAKATRQPLAFRLTGKLIAVVIGAMVLLLLGDFSYNAGILHGFVSLVAPVASSSPVLFVILSRFVFKDRLTRQQAVGMVCTLVGILILAFNS